MIAAVVAFTLLPLIAFRRSTLWRYLVLDVGTYALAALLWRHLESVDPWFAAVVFFGGKLALFSLFLANGEYVKWSAGLAVIITLLVYSLLIPANNRAPIDGDEPYYLLIAESIAHDGDLDLANQYAHLDKSAAGRTDLRPQLGDRTGAKGEQYSRLEPFLPLLLIPGLMAGGLTGAVSTIVLFAILLVRSTIRWLEDEGIEERTIRAIFPFLAFGPPVIFFAARIWPEIPAAFFFVEALRGVRARRTRKWIAATAALCALKFRFALLAVSLAIRRPLFIAVLIALIVLVGAVTGSFGLTANPAKYATGFFGLMLDGAAGLAFQAPFFLLGVFALTRWKSMPEGFRLGIITSLLYLVLLVPRSEWHGGWSPPLRYIVFLMPVLAFGAAAMWLRISAAFIAIIGAWTLGVVAHGVAYPWRLFHIANGENVAGETLSRMFGSDFSRLFPSFIRLNEAAVVAAVVLVFVFFVSFVVEKAFPPQSTQRTQRLPLALIVAVAFVAWFFITGQKPANVIHFEDAHVTKNGGELYPPEFTVARFNYRGGWMLHGGNSLSFLTRAGEKQLHYASREPVIIELGARRYDLPPTADAYKTVRVSIDRGGRIELRCLSGSVNLERIE